MYDLSCSFVSCVLCRLPSKPAACCRARRPPPTQPQLATWHQLTVTRWAVICCLHKHACWLLTDSHRNRVSGCWGQEPRFQVALVSGRDSTCVHHLCLGQPSCRRPCCCLPLPLPPHTRTQLQPLLSTHIQLSEHRRLCASPSDPHVLLLPCKHTHRLPYPCVLCVWSLFCLLSPCVPTQAPAVLAVAAKENLSGLLVPGHPYIEAEVVHACR
jgi:hypothetical protein